MTAVNVFIFFLIYQVQDTFNKPGVGFTPVKLIRGNGNNGQTTIETCTNDKKIKH